MKNRKANFTSFIFILALFFILVQELTTAFNVFDLVLSINKRHTSIAEKKSPTETAAAI